MDFCIETKELQRVIRLLGVTAKVNTYDFTGQVLIEANEDNTVLFVSNNNSTAITILSDKAKVTTPGSVVTVYGKIKSFANSFAPWDGEFGTKEVHFVHDEDVKVTVDTIHENGKKSKGKLKAPSFRDMRLQKPKPFGETHFILNSNMFKKAVGKVIYAMDPTEQRTFIQGMNISFSEEDIFFCGTNGRILSEYAVKNNNDLSGQSHLMRYDFIMGLRRAVGEETQIFFEVDGRDIRAKFENVVFSGRLVVGQEYPPYKQVLETFSTTIAIDKEALMGVLTPFTDLLNNEDNNRLTFEIQNGKIKLYNDDAEFECNFDIEHAQGFVIDVNGKFLYQTIEAINDDTVLVKFSDDKGVFIFDSGNFKDQKALITPIRRR